jgi:hypothetical protein
MEETTKSLWNKTADELTVKDSLVASVVITVATVGGIIAIGVGIDGASRVRTKFREFRANRQNKKTETES